MPTAKVHQTQTCSGPVWLSGLSSIWQLSIPCSFTRCMRASDRLHATPWSSLFNTLFTYFASPLLLGSDKCVLIFNASNNRSYAFPGPTNKNTSTCTTTVQPTCPHTDSCNSLALNPSPSIFPLPPPSGEHPQSRTLSSQDAPSPCHLHVVDLVVEVQIRCSSP